MLVRRLHCRRGEADVALHIEPRYNFGPALEARSAVSSAVFEFDGHTLGLWMSRRPTLGDDGSARTFQLKAGEDVWVVLALDENPALWSVERAAAAMEATAAYWRSWQRSLLYSGPRGSLVRRSALTVHLLSYAPAGSMVAAPTTSLPERIGGDRNYDYRFAWIRDASLSMAILAMLGCTNTAAEYMDWLAGLDSVTDSPLQVMYGVRGGTDLTQIERTDLAGYRQSRPVRFANHAFSQSQLDSLGYLIDCALVYLKRGGAWRPEYWDLICRSAEFTVKTWQETDNGIWELPQSPHYLSSKVMSWVALDRAVKIAKRTGHKDETETWRRTMDIIHAEVPNRGWSDQMGSFRQCYDEDQMDSSVLLISVMGFLPDRDPRIIATIEQVAEKLAIDGLVHRFGAGDTPDNPHMALGEFEGAFLPCTFWLATAYAKAGKPDAAEAILVRAEAVAGELGLFAEEIDAVNGGFLGNTPLLYSHLEYIRAVTEVAKAAPITKMQLMPGKARQLVKRVTDRS